MKRKISKKNICLGISSIMIFALFPRIVIADDNSFTITNVSYDGTARVQSEEFSTITEITYTDKGVSNTVVIDSDKVATLTVDGTQQDIVEGNSYNYNNEAIINLTNKDETNLEAKGGPGLMFYWGFENPGVPLNYYLRAGAFVENNDLLEDYSVSNAIVSGEVGDNSAKDVVIDSQGNYFNGFVIRNSDYEIDGVDIKLVGSGGDDFSGWGSGIMIDGTSNVKINKAMIDTTGAIRTAIWAGGTNSIVDVTNSVVMAYGADENSADYKNLAVPMMVRVPWALGLEGNTRATNVLGSATANYVDSIVVSDEWGALSTDSGVDGTNALNVSNTLSGIGTLEVAKDGKNYTATKRVNGVDYGFTMSGSGYVTYADAGVYNNYDNVEFYAPDYAIILASMTSSSNFTGEDTVVVTDRIGAMFHQNKDGELNIKDGSWTVGDTMFLVKSATGAAAGSDTDLSCYPNIVVDGTEIEITGENDYSGVLYQLMDTDDAGGPFIDSPMMMGENAGYTIPMQEDDWSTVELIEEELPDADTVFKNIDVEGDIYNSVYSFNEDLNVTLENSKITGVISSSNANHVDEVGNILQGGTHLSMYNQDDYLGLGRVVNTPSEAVNNEVNLTLENTVWKVTETSYLSELKIDGNSEIIAENGSEVTLIVNGVEQDITIGEYSGSIVVKVGDKADVDFDTLPNNQGGLIYDSTTNKEVLLKTINNNVYVPVRSFTENILGGSVSYEPLTKDITLVINEKSTVLNPNNKDSGVIILDNYSYAPLYQVEKLGLSVVYDKNTGVVNIYK